MKVKSNFNVFLGIAGILFSLLHFILGTIGYQYRPRSYIVFIILYFTVVVCITAFSILFKKYARKKAVVFGCIMPFVALLYEISLLFFFDFMIDYLSYHLLYFELLFGIAMVSSIVIFFVYNPLLWLRIFGIISTSIFVWIFGFVFFISLFFSDFGSNTVIETIYSPEKTYKVWVITSDQGALGGDTFVNAQNMKTEIKFLTGTIIGQRKRIWTGDWGKEPVLEWKDEHTLLIDGVGYRVGYVLEMDYGNHYRDSAKLKVFIPERKPDYLTDTHGGFHGDGDRLETFVLTSEEIELMEQDIKMNAYWHQIDEENKGILYGGEKGYFTHGFLQESVPVIDDGYYCVYDKQTKMAEFPKSESSSYNYLIGVYSVKRKILYVFEMDT